MEATASGWQEKTLASVVANSQPHLPDSSGGQCSPAASPRLHNLSGDCQLFSSLQPRPELEEEGSSPTLLRGEHKALFLSSNACFFLRADSPAHRECIALSWFWLG